MPNLNIAFDGKSSLELLEFVRKYKDIFSSGNIIIKLNDLLAEMGIEWLKVLEHQIKTETGVDITWMIDGKWYDIPNTVANYAKRLEWLSVAYYTVHASGGIAMIRAAKKVAPNTKLLAITILTSMNDDEVIAVYDASRAESILRLAKVALAAGADGLVCSPADTAMLRQVFGEKYWDFLLVTPNIAREWVERDDDQNTSLTNTPRGAIENGSSDIVVGRPILTAENPWAVITEMLEQMDSAKFPSWGVANSDGVVASDFSFEKVLHTGSWDELLRYIGAIYVRPENGKYVRHTSGLIADAYTNNSLSEREYRVLERASTDIAEQMRTRNIQPDIVMGAQMWSVRMSLSLAKSLSISESIYTEKDGDAMNLKRHDLGEEGFLWKKIVLSEDVITKWSTIAKMIEIVKQWWGQVVAVTCIVNRSGKDNFEGIPLFHCYVPASFGRWWDDETLVKTRRNEGEAGKSPEQIEESVSRIQSEYPRIPETAVVAEKPKNEWNQLVMSMRD